MAALLYWGVYNLSEKIDDDFMASYGGGEGSDWYLADEQGTFAGGKNGSEATLDYLFTSLALSSQLSSELISAEYLSEILATLASYRE